jgi:hypothetical protein
MWITEWLIWLITRYIGSSVDLKYLYPKVRVGVGSGLGPTSILADDSPSDDVTGVLVSCSNHVAA